MKIQLLRHATLMIELGGHSMLLDPMLSPAEAWDPVRNSHNPRRNPMVDLPLDDADLGRLLTDLAAVFVTHTHADHWDDPAKQRLAKQLPLFCQPNDTDSIRSDGFEQVLPVDDELNWEGIQVSRTGGRHGTGEVAERIGPVSGFVLRSGGEPTLYVAGDTVWCPEVEQALSQHRPELVVVNAGAAQFVDSDPITMNSGDVARVARAVPDATVVPVHMETINHCGLTRSALHAALQAERLSEQIWIPEDGEARTF